MAPRHYPWVRWISIQGRVGFCDSYTHKTTKSQVN